MDTFAVAVMPVTDVGLWKEFCGEATSGDRAQAHREFLRRGGVTAEHIIHQPTPMGDLAVLIWEGVDQAGAGALMGSVIQNPQTEHESYLRDYVLTKLHGLDTGAPPPPPAERIGTVRP